MSSVLGCIEALLWDRELSEVMGYADTLRYIDRDGISADRIGDGLNPLTMR